MPDILKWLQIGSLVFSAILLPFLGWLWRKTIVTKEELAATERRHNDNVQLLTTRIGELEHEVKLLEVTIDSLPQREDFARLQNTVNELSREIGALTAISGANQKTLDRIDEFLMNDNRT